MEPANVSRGLFLSLDGVDGTGKSTQCRLLADWLRGRGLAVTQCADPGGTAIGDALRDLLLDHRQEMALPCEALLFMASRAQLTAEVIRPALEAGQAVVADRAQAGVTTRGRHGPGWQHRYREGRRGLVDDRPRCRFERLS